VYTAVASAAFSRVDAPGVETSGVTALHCVPSRSGKAAAITSTRVVVVDNQIEPALKALKKQMLKDGLFQEMKRRVAYDKPSVKRKRKQAAARKKRRKAMRRMEQHDRD